MYIVSLPLKSIPGQTLQIVAPANMLYCRIPGTMYCIQTVVLFVNRGHQTSGHFVLFDRLRTRNVFVIPPNLSIGYRIVLRSTRY